MIRSNIFCHAVGDAMFQSFGSTQYPLLPEKPLRVSKFVKKLYDVTSGKFPGVIGFNSEGTAIKVHDVELLEKVVLRHTFGHANYSSFTRQLNNYNFAKNRGSDTIEFSQPYFLRDRPDLLPYVNRGALNPKDKSKNGSLSSHSNGTERNISTQASNDDKQFSKEALERSRNEHDVLAAERDVLHYRILQIKEEERYHLDELNRIRSMIDQLRSGRDANQLQNQIPQTVVPTVHCQDIPRSQELQNMFSNEHDPEPQTQPKRAKYARAANEEMTSVSNTCDSVSESGFWRSVQGRSEDKSGPVCTFGEAGKFAYDEYLRFSEC